MGRFAYVNGRFTRHAEAMVHVEDRGYQFADAIYEVWSVADGRLMDCEGHFSRLERSLSELAIPMPMSRGALFTVLKEALRRNHVRDGLVYLQVSRGVAPRDHAIPTPTLTPSVVITAKSLNPAKVAAKGEAGGAVITVPENRWGRCDIKTVGLLPNALAKTAAKAAGAVEAWFVDKDGLVTEGASTNAWIVDQAGVLRTRDIGANILRGITRAHVLRLAEELQLRVEEGPFSVADAKAAKEAFITAASAYVTPITAIDGVPVGDGRPGAVTLRLRSLYVQQAEAEAV